MACSEEQALECLALVLVECMHTKKVEEHKLNSQAHRNTQYEAYLQAKRSADYDGCLSLFCLSLFKPAAQRVPDQYTFQQQCRRLEPLLRPTAKGFLEEQFEQTGVAPDAGAKWVQDTLTMWQHHLQINQVDKHNAP